MKPASPPYIEGTTVRHRRGGPLMAVELVLGELLLCTWLDEHAAAQRRSFFAAELVVEDPAHPPWMTAMARLAARYAVVSTC